MLRTDDLDYALPEDLIATRPAEPRDSARLLVVSRTDPSRLEDRVVRELPEVLRPPSARGTMPPDLMVVNATRVLPARFLGVRDDTGGHAEGLYVQPAPEEHPAARSGPLWIVLLKMRRARQGALIRLSDRHGRDSGVRLRLIERVGQAGGVHAGGGEVGGADGGWIVLVESEKLALTPGLTADDLLEWIGLTPVPPYILAARRRGHEDVADDADRKAYQTVYATDKGERPGRGSVAAPTAGLHFTPALLERLGDAGVRRAEVTLDVGLGTFKPVETEFVEQHPMHTEWCGVPTSTAAEIASVRRAGGRIIAVGTTAARTLESFESTDEMLGVQSRDTSVLITPGYRFRHVDAMVTNFHLPRSTLLAMVSALFVADGADPMSGVDRLKAIYAHALSKRYRFYSYGDAMLILP
jgi:S-adenosylmethionine:tRNA ribosyltransferase-isomerase